MSHPPASESWYKWIAFRYGGQSRAGGSPRHFLCLDPLQARDKNERGIPRDAPLQNTADSLIRINRPINP